MEGAEESTIRASPNGTPAEWWSITRQGSPVTVEPRDPVRSGVEQSTMTTAVDVRLSTGTVRAKSASNGAISGLSNGPAE